MPAASDKTRRYRTFASYLRETFGCRVQKIGLDAGFSCPNRDGTCGTGGCSYCDNESFSHHTNATTPPIPLEQQLARGIENLVRRYQEIKIIAYFQAFTGTHAPPEVLRSRFEVIRKFPEIVGLFISTRPDCVSEQVLELIASYRDEYLTWLELGLQSASDTTLRQINRGHTSVDFSHAVERAHEYGLPVCAHVILGLPGETWDTMLATADFLNACKVESVKVHCLHVMEGTRLADQWRAGEVKLLAQQEYVPLACDFLEHLAPEVIIQRLTVDVKGNGLLGPLWCGRGKQETMRMIELELEHRGSRQGASLC
jgi:uncharacterized protein